MIILQCMLRKYTLIIRTNISMPSSYSIPTKMTCKAYNHKQICQRLNNLEESRHVITCHPLDNGEYHNLFQQLMFPENVFALPNRVLIPFKCPLSYDFQLEAYNENSQAQYTPLFADTAFHFKPKTLSASSKGVI